MRILGIETSCDETGIAVYDSEKGIVAEQLYSQIKTHARYGGVVPELASREHVARIFGLVEATLEISGPVDAIAFTQGPGLAGSLMVGSAFGQALAMAWKVPLYPIHHMEAHLLAATLGSDDKVWPALALLVSGGHCMLVGCDDVGRYRVVGQTLDDAVGEAFDKVAKLLGLGYPGGPAVAELAKAGQAGRFQLPRPMLKKPGFDFSYSGLKTAVVLAYQASDQSHQAKADLALAFEEAAIECLVEQSKKALSHFGYKRLIVAGGVAANQRLRRSLDMLEKTLGVEVFIPPAQLCTDNGAMVAYAGFVRAQMSDAADESLNVRPRWPLSELVA